MALKAIKKGESAPRSAKVEGDVVRFQHLTLHKPSGVHYALTTSFDFAGVPADVIKRLAGETLLIRWRGAFKNAEKVDDTADNTVQNVLQMLKGRKPRMSKLERIDKLATEISKAEKIALLRKLQAEIEEQEEQETIEDTEEDFEEEEEEEEELDEDEQ